MIVTVIVTVPATVIVIDMETMIMMEIDTIVEIVCVRETTIVIMIGIGIGIGIEIICIGTGIGTGIITIEIVGIIPLTVMSTPLCRMVGQIFARTSKTLSFSAFSIFLSFFRSFFFYLFLYDTFFLADCRDFFFCFLSGIFFGKLVSILLLLVTLLRIPSNLPLWMPQWIHIVPATRLNSIQCKIQLAFLHILGWEFSRILKSVYLIQQ